MKCEKLLEHMNVFDDFSTGDRICMQCGIVVDTAFSVNLKNSFAHEDNECDDKNIRREVRNYLALLFIESTKVENKIIELWQQLNIKNRKHNGSPIIHRKKSILAYAIWESLNVLRQPRPLEEIAGICGLREKHLLAVEKYLDITQTFLPCSEYAERIVDTLKLPYWFLRIIKEILQNTHMLSTYKPVNAIGVIIVLLCKIITKRKLQQYKNNKNSLMYHLLSKAENDQKFNAKVWTTRKICLELSANPGVFYRIFSKIKMDYLTHVLESNKLNTYY